jgi:hypothetical protein
MLPNINPALYAQFKIEGYRIKRYKSAPVMTIPEIVRLAYLDVNRTLQGIQPNQKARFRESGVTFLRDFLTAPPLDQNGFDTLHRQGCERCLSNPSPPGTTIHYGQAQKLINMSLKYLYNEFAVGGAAQDHFGFPNGTEQFFHLPIDSHIRNALVRFSHFRAPKSVPWSQWKYEDYTAFQQQVRNRLHRSYKPLEVDYLVWNAISTALSRLF